VGRSRCTTEHVYSGLTVVSSATSIEITRRRHAAKSVSHTLPARDQSHLINAQFTRFVASGGVNWAQVAVARVFRAGLIALKST